MHRERDFNLPPPMYNQYGMYPTLNLNGYGGMNGGMNSRMNNRMNREGVKVEKENTFAERARKIKIIYDSMVEHKNKLLDYTYLPRSIDTSLTSTDISTDTPTLSSSEIKEDIKSLHLPSSVEIKEVQKEQKEEEVQEKKEVEIKEEVQEKKEQKEVQEKKHDSLLMQKFIITTLVILILFFLLILIVLLVAGLANREAIIVLLVIIAILILVVIIFWYQYQSCA